MIAWCRFVGLLSVSLAVIAMTGCSNRPPGDIGAPGVTPPDAPKTSEEAIQQEELRPNHHEKKKVRPNNIKKKKTRPINIEKKSPRTKKS